MRRLLTEPWGYLAAFGRTLARGWNAFFFTPADPIALGVLRVVLGLLLLWNLGVFGLDLHAFFGSDGWADPQTVRSFWEPDAPHWSFWLWVPDHLLGPVWAGCMLVLAAFTLGLGSRVTAVLAWVIVVSTTKRVPVAQFGFDQIISMLTLYLAVTGASGQAVSLDRFLQRWRYTHAAFDRRREPGRGDPIPPGTPEPTVSANLALRLIQLHLVVIYGTAGLAKLLGPGWWTGLSVWHTLVNPEFRLFDLTWVAAYPELISLLALATLALEIGYPVLIWFRLWRPLLLASVVAMHLGIGLTLGLTEFAVAMIAANLAFVSGSWLRSLVTGTTQPAGRVLYDGACPRCRASMALVAAADPDRVVEPVDLTAVNVATIHPSLTKAACLKSMHLVRSDGRVFAGYDAVRRLLLWHPLTWPLALLGALPPLAWAGRRGYQALAGTRPRDPCSEEVCGLHASSSKVGARSQGRKPHGPDDVAASASLRRTSR